MYGVFGREITKYTVISGEKKRFWPTPVTIIKLRRAPEFPQALHWSLVFKLLRAAFPTNHRYIE